MPEWLSNLDLLSPVSLAAVGVLLAALFVGLLVARFAAGPPTQIARRAGLFVIRGLVIATLLLLLFNPVEVTESPGPIEKPEVFFVVDTSESMLMGGESTRWDELRQVLRETDEQTRDKSLADISMFRFGHRLSSIEDASQLVGRRERVDTVTPVSRDASKDNDEKPEIEPTDTDTRMVKALRQVTSRFGRSPPSSIVLFSDGRARNATAVKEIAEQFARLNVPIHVVPIGGKAKGGDIAIVAVVAPEYVRNQSQVEVQVLLRSFGYEGKHIDVQLWTVDNDKKPVRQVASQPMTLSSGVERPISLTFRADLKTRRLMVMVAPQEDEIDLENNVARARVSLLRQKIRVLYVEGNPRPAMTTRRGEEVITRGPYSDLADALSADQDIECVTIAATGGQQRRVGQKGKLDENRGFPETKAELSAYDALILSNVSREYFTDKQIEWIDSWISERGGGICMLGGPNSFAAGGWSGTAVEKMLPFVLNEEENVDDWAPDSVKLTPEMSSGLHPIFHIVSDVKQNQAIVGEIPIFEGVNRSLQIKSSLAKPIGTADETPIFATGQYGQGRSVAMATAITSPHASAFVDDWGEGDNRYYAKFWRNVVYWVTEKSLIGRRRLIASHDKRSYKPGDAISLTAVAYDEGANLTQDYRIVVTVDPPPSALLNLTSDYSPVRWPNGIQRTSGEDGPFVAWGEDFELPRLTADRANVTGGNKLGYGIQLPIGDLLAEGADYEGLRIELTAYEDFTQVDSTSMDVQIVHDPFEQQNPFPNHELLEDIAETSGGQVLSDSNELSVMLTSLQAKTGAPIVSKAPIWSRWELLAVIVGLLTIEWFWRRHVGLA